MRKTKAIERHFDKRAGERLGYQLPPSVRAEIVTQIQAGRATFLRRTSNARTVWQVEIEQEIRTVVYDKRRKMIVTIW